MVRVLVIEDNAGDIELVRRRLADVRIERFEVSWAETLEEGIAAYRSSPSDVVLLDLHLPDSAGLETIDAFRRQARDAPMVVMTGTSDVEAGIEALRHGADDYIEKQQLSSDLLARTIRYAVERRRVTSSLERERATVEILKDVGAVLAAELDRERLAQKITDLATRLVGADFGAFFYTVSAPGGGQVLLYTLSGIHGSAVEQFSVPLATRLLDGTFEGQSVVRSDDVRLDPRCGPASPFFGMPPGQLPVVSYLAAPVVLRNGDVAGGLFFGHPDRGRFGADHERLAVGVGEWAAVAMDNARLYDEALRAARARENLLQVVSHDLRNHVGTMIFALRLVREKTPPESLRQVEAVERASTTMRRLLEDLVDIAAIEKGVLSVHTSPVDARLLLEEARELLAPSIESRRIHLKWSSVDPGVIVLADRERILQVIGNLVGNAVKFTPAGGEIIVTAAVRTSDVEVAVQDTGPGIPAQDRERIFDRFFRGSRPSGHGAGLGLAIARALVHAHGGDIGVRSEPGSGARFSFTLPRQGSTDDAAPPEGPTG